MAPTAVKRGYPEPVAWVDVRPTKMQRTTVIHNGILPAQPQPVQQMTSPSIHHYQAMYGNGGPPQVQSQPIAPDALWKTINTMDVNTLREQIFHATVGNMSLPQIASRVLDVHSTRLRLEAEAAENARKAGEAKERRDRKKIFDFDSHYRQIDDWLSNDPIDRKACRTSYAIYEKIVARIDKITAKATEGTTNFSSKCNALATLTGIVESMIDNKTGAMGCEIWHYMAHDGSIEESMMKIIRTMNSDERRMLLGVVLDDNTLWVEKVKTLDARSQAAYRPQTDRQGQPFPNLCEVPAFIIGPRIKQEIIEEASTVQRPADGGQVKREIKKEMNVKQEGEFE